MPAYWCANFDADACPAGDAECVLRHGVDENSWLLQYQYSHKGHAYQGHRRQKAATTKNWRAAGNVKPGDWLVAYLKGNKFYAIGQVIEPRKRERHRGCQVHRDSIERTVTEHRHEFSDGVVHYTSVFYEDFTDPWSVSVINPHSNQREVWRYNQRIDVESWDEFQPQGVQVRGLRDAAVREWYRDAIFEIRESFFAQVRAALRAHH
jgi:hypothetical protein